MSSEEQGRVPGSGSPTSRKRTSDLGPKRSLEPGKELSKPGRGGGSVEPGAPGEPEQRRQGPQRTRGECREAPGEPEQRCRGSQRTQGSVEGLPGNLSRGAGGPREPGGKCRGAPGEPEQRHRGSQRTRGEMSGGSWGNQGRWGWGGGLPGNLANTLRVPAGLRRASGGTGRNREGKGRKRARTKQECFSRSFPDYQPHPGAVGSCLLCAAAAKQRKLGSQAEAVERRGLESRGDTILHGDLCLDRPRG